MSSPVADISVIVYRVAVGVGEPHHVVCLVLYLVGLLTGPECKGKYMSLKRT